jgi:hypothetical protein
MTATASSITAIRIDGAPTFFIAHLISSVTYHAERRDLSNKKFGVPDDNELSA